MTTRAHLRCFSNYDSSKHNSNQNGLWLSLGNSSNSNAAVIRGNLFRNNNNDGEHSGRGIYTNGGLSGANLTNVTIDNNAFINNYGSSVTTIALEAAIALQTLATGQQNNIRITNNFFDQNGNRDSSKSFITSSVGLFANARLVDIMGALAKRPWHDDLLLGAGFNYVAWANEHYNPNIGGYSDFFTNTQAFVALQYLVRKQLFVKLVGAYAKSRFEKAFATVGDYNDTMLSARLRVLYLF